MTATGPYSLAAIDLSGSQYSVEQTGQDENFRPEYEASNVTGDTIFRATYEMYQSEDEFSFVDADGAEIGTVTASGTLDVAGNYTLTDGRTGEDVVVLDNDLSVFQDTWRIRDADDGSLLAAIDSGGALVTAGRTLLPIGQWIGHSYEVTDAEGDSVGSIESGFAVFDQYEITIADPSSVPVAAIVVATVVIDAIQGN
jgi:uncharacterized protein YxjI